MGKVRDLVKDALNIDDIKFIGDSGTSVTSTPFIGDFTEYSELTTKLEAWTANKGVPLAIKGSRTVFMKHEVEKGKYVTLHMSPVFHIPGLSM